jgi:hypothetical protein
MSSPLLRRAAARAGKRIPGVRALPIMRLLALGEIAVLAKQHLDRLEPHERRRLIELARAGRGRPGTLSRRQREELRQLVAKIDPKAFVGEAAERFSPVPLPRRRRRGG